MQELRAGFGRNLKQLSVEITEVDPQQKEDIASLRRTALPQLPQSRVETSRKNGAGLDF